MAYVLDVIEELAAAAYERGVRTISVSQVERELSNVGQYSERNVEAVCETLSDLDYLVTTTRKIDRVKKCPSSSNLKACGAKGEKPMNSAEGARSRSRGAPAFLCVDRMVEDLSATLKRTGAGTVETAVLDPTVQMAADEEMHEAFDALAGAFDPGTAVMILGRLVGRGCALLSVSVKSAHERGDLKKSLRMVKRIVRRQRGAMRTVEGKNETRINLYFPVRNGSS